MNRREFLTKAASSTVLATISLPILTSVIQSCATSPTGPNVTHGTTTIDVSSLTADNQSFVSTTVYPDGTPILVIRKSATNYEALSMYCPHEGCQVNPPQSNQIYCACHGSRFDLNGNVIAGPASSSLAKYTSVYNASAKTITVTY